MSRHGRGCWWLAAGMVLTSLTCAYAQDWPQWLGANRDGKPSEFSAPAEWPATLTQAWQVAVGPGDASPVVVGDMLYVFSRQGDEEVTRCLNISDGSEVWADKYAAPAVPGPASSHPGPRGTPAVADGKIVTLGVAGAVSCLDAANGAVLWRKDPFSGAVPRFNTAMSPLIVDGLAIAHLGKEDSGALIAFDLTTGEEKWRWDGEGPQYASPALLTVGDAKVIVSLSAVSFIGVAAADGALLWQRPFVPSGRAYNAATPVISGDTVIISGAGRGTMAYQVAPEGDGVTVTELWNNNEQAVQYNTPILKDGLLFGLSSRGNLFCLSAETGETAWADETSRGRGFGDIVDAGTALLVLPDNGELIAYQPTADGFTELAKYQVAEGGTYASPVLSGNRIITKDQAVVTVWTLP